MMITCDCEVYEICPSCAPSGPAYARAVEFNNKAVRDAVNNDRRRQLEHELATTFIAQQKERMPSERQRLWLECLRLTAEIEKLEQGGVIQSYEKEAERT